MNKNAENMFRTLLYDKDSMLDLCIKVELLVNGDWET